MYKFFYSLFTALFTGNWVEHTQAEATTALTNTWNGLTNWILNALGGEFTTLQTFTWEATPLEIWATILALITITLIAWLTWKITKYVFGIFFGGARR